MKESIYVNSLLTKETFPRYWNSKRCKHVTNYKPNNPVYIHEIELPENTTDFLCSLCRYGAEQGKRGSHMLWGPDFSWWVSEKPKAKAMGMKEPCWGQFSKTKLPPRTQLARDIIKKDIANAHESPFYQGKIKFGIFEK